MSHLIISTMPPKCFGQGNLGYINKVKAYDIALTIDNIILAVVIAVGLISLLTPYLFKCPAASWAMIAGGAVGLAFCMPNNIGKVCHAISNRKKSLEQEF